MERVFGVQKLQRNIPRPVATLGVFDGVHRGHLHVLAEVRDWAAQIGGTSVVITFDRHPDAVLHGRPSESITSLEHRLSLIEKAGIDVAVVLHFTPELAAMEPEDFVREILVEKLGIVGIVFGYNARFGRRARGDAEVLKRLGAEYGFEVRVPKPLLIDGAPVSSTRVRMLIREGNLDEAARLLGRLVSLRGTVVHGDRRGANIGWPTANLNLHHEVTPPDGVYIGRASRGGQTWWGLANIGRRPTFHEEEHARRTVEVWLDGFEGSLYGETLELELLLRLRREMKFSSAEDLARQIEKDRRMLETFRRESGGKPVAKS